MGGSSALGSNYGRRGAGGGDGRGGSSATAGSHSNLGSNLDYDDPGGAGVIDIGRDIDGSEPNPLSRIPCVKCPFHGWTFRLDTGACVVGPIDPTTVAPQLVYPVRASTEVVMVDVTLPNGDIGKEEDRFLEVGFQDFNSSVFEDEDF